MSLLLISRAKVVNTCSFTIRLLLQLSEFDDIELDAVALAAVAGSWLHQGRC